jgi:hypothetical protein
MDERTEATSDLMEMSSSSLLSPPRVATNDSTTLTLGSISVHDNVKQSGLEWMNWNVTYVVTDLGRAYWTLNSTGNLVYRHDDATQNDVQTILEGAIENGNTTAQLQELVDSSLPLFSVHGKEVDAFYDAHISLMEEYDIFHGAKMLRLFGIGIVVLTMVLVLVLTRAGRRRRFIKNWNAQQSSMPRQEPADLEVPYLDSNTSIHFHHQADDVALFETEESVNRMLLIGKQQVLLHQQHFMPTLSH